jgi:serine/threonine-protein kinase
MHYSYYQLAMGRADEALELSRRAVAIDPLSPAMNHIYGMQLVVNGRYDEAKTQLEHTIELDRTFAQAYLGLAEMHLLQGKFDLGLQEYRKSVELGGLASPGDSMMVLALVDAYRGNKARAYEGLQRYVAQYGERDQPGTMYYIAAIYGALGRKDEAFAWLARAYRNHDEALVGLKLDPLMAPLRDDPRFAALLMRMKLPVDPAPGAPPALPSATGKS